jgi:hypothetical protein
MGRDAVPGVLGSATLGRVRGWREDLRFVVWLLPVVGQRVTLGDHTNEVALSVGLLVHGPEADDAARRSD